MSSLITYPEVEQRSPEWHDQRRGMVTASVVGSLLTVRTMTAIEYACPSCESPAGEPCVSRRKGADPTPIKTTHAERTAAAHAGRATSPTIIETSTGDTARSVMLTLTAERIAGHTDDRPMTSDMWRGVEDEPRARDAYAAHAGVEVDEVGFMVREFESGHRLGYSPDGLVGDDGLIEVKSRLQKSQLATVLSGRVPAEHMAQCQAGLLVSGRKWLDYVSYRGGMHLWIKRVYPDPVWQAGILGALAAFESAAEQYASDYFAAVEGLPLTEYIAPIPELVI